MGEHHQGKLGQYGQRTRWNTMQNKQRELLFICGIIAPFFFFGIDMLAGSLWTGYNFVSQSLSDLSAVGAPTRPLVMVLQLVFDMLMIAFGIGVWKKGGHNRALRVSGAAIIGNAAISSIVRAFVPWYLGKPASEPANTLNTVIMFFGMVAFLLAMISGGAAFHDWFRAYSFGTLLAYLGLCLLSLIVLSAIPAMQGTPTIGIQERTMVYGFLVWIALLALTFLRKTNRSEPIQERIA
jgi:hypothetical protein